MEETLAVRLGGPADVDAAVAVWRTANTARRGGRPIPAEHDERIRRFARTPDAFLIVAADAGEVVGMALGLQGLDADGAGPPLPGLCHVSAVFVAPDRWGRGIGGPVVGAVLAEAWSRGCDRVQLWTHADNTRARRLDEGRGFLPSGRELDDDLGERIVHYQRPL